MNKRVGFELQNIGFVTEKPTLLKQLNTSYKNIY